MNEMQIFNNPQFGEIRTVLIDEEPWFVGKDVATILEYTNPSKALTDHVDPEDKLNNESLSSLGQRGGWFINESGLYSLILSSKMPNAKKFKRWVTSEVLPSIRKHGAYLTPQKIEEVLLNPDAIIKLATALKEEQEKRMALETVAAVQQQQIAELNPKATYYDLVLQCPDLISVTEIAKDYGRSAKWLNRLLEENKVQFKQGGIWILYDKYARKGYTSTKKDTFPDKNGVLHTKAHTYWTQQGRLFLYSLLKDLGHLPIVEQQQDNTDKDAS